jgi:hypothetical protein
MHMWEQDWALLGIEPTTELAAIKKAYALKLKVTRPDDDAQAYQALHGAYERAQQWLKWQQQEANQISVEPAAAPLQVSSAAEPPAAAVDASDALAPPEPVVQPQQLINQLALCWRRSGESALLLEWSTVQRQLDQEPLNRHVEFSAAFAEWVLGTQALPDDFLLALNSHFGWLDDFRTERQLGAPLTHALQAALNGRLRPAPLPEMVQELAAPLQALTALREAGHAWWRLQWLFFLLQPLLARQKNMLGNDWLQRLGVAPQWLADGIKHGLWWRVALATGLFWGAALLVYGDVIIAAGHAAVWLIGTAVFMLASLLAGALVGVGPTLTTPKRRLALPLDKWRRHRQQPLLGLIWLLFAAWMAYLDATPGTSNSDGLLSLLPPWVYSYAAWGFAIAGLLTAWPLDTLRGCVVVGLAPMVGYLAMALLGSWLPAQSSLLIGAAWMLLATAVHEERLPVSAASPVRWLLRPMLNSLLLADRWTFSVALLPLATSTAWAMITDGNVSPTRIFLIWVLSILATGWLQTKADAWGLRQLQAARAQTNAR